MADYQIPRNGNAKLDVVDGELKVGNNGTIKAAKGKLVRVSGAAIFEGDCDVGCSFECDSLNVKHGGTLRVIGDLTVHKLLDVIHSVDAKGVIDAGEIDVGGRVHAGSIRCKDRVRVGGRLDVKDGVEAKLLDVGGQASAKGTVKLQDLQVGGVAEIGGGSILGKIQVGGKFESSGPLEFGEIQVYGKITLASNSRGRKILTYGKLTAKGDLECGELELMGRAEVNGNCKAGRIESSSKLSVSGSLEATEEVRSLGHTDIQGDFRGADLRIGGRFRARRVISINEIELAGDADAAQGLKAKTVLVRGGSKCTGTLVAEKVEVGRSYDVMSNWGTKFAGQSAMFRLIGKETRVGDVYAQEVRLGKASRCGRIFARTVEFGEGVIAEEINYTDEARGPVEKVYINKKFPKKVERLPEPPL